jgi:hypothetical protein
MPYGSGRLLGIEEQIEFITILKLICSLSLLKERVDLHMPLC